MELIQGICFACTATTAWRSPRVGWFSGRAEPARVQDLSLQFIIERRTLSAKTWSERKSKISWVVKTLWRRLTKPTVEFCIYLFGGTYLVAIDSNDGFCQRDVHGTDATVHKLSFIRCKSEVQTSRWQHSTRSDGSGDVSPYLLISR